MTGKSYNQQIKADIAQLDDDVDITSYNNDASPLTGDEKPRQTRPKKLPTLLERVHGLSIKDRARRSRLENESLEDAEKRVRQEDLLIIDAAVTAVKPAETSPLRHSESADRQPIPAVTPQAEIKPVRGYKSTMRQPPKDDKQADFFVPNLYDVATKDNRSLMDVALFRLSKRDKRAGEVIRYELPDGYVEVKAGADGMASIWDYDIVLMMISHLTESMNLFKAGRATMPGRTFIPTASDIAKFCRRGDGGRQADEIEAALDRLQGTAIKSVRMMSSKDGQPAEKRVESEGLIGPYRIQSRTDSGKISRIEIDVPSWIYREVTSGSRPEVLTVHPDYFLIEPGLGRFVYRLARKAAGKDEARWLFKTIYERSGSAGSFKEFCRMMRKLISANGLPEYELEEDKGQGGPMLVITNRQVISEKALA